MASAKAIKKTGKKTAKKAKPEPVAKKSKSDSKKPDKKVVSKKPVKKASGEFRARSNDFDDYVIRRLVKENPRRAGSRKAKVWSILKKGMTVGEFVKKGGAKTELRAYIENGWAKVKRPAATASDAEA